MDQRWGSGHLVFLKHAQEMVAKLGYFGPLVVDMRLDGIRGSRWIYFEQQTPMEGPISDLDDDVSFSIAVTTEDLATRIDGVARDLLRTVFFAMNWADLAESDEGLLTTLKAGYKYNMWKTPDAFQL